MRPLKAGIIWNSKSNMKFILCLALLVSVALSADCWTSAAAALTAQIDATGTTAVNVGAVLTACTHQTERFMQITNTPQELMLRPETF
jgi:hypothetical protein